ncbi:unnamed protein product [Hymenolepis diminuta]|uniref:Uncharacterized protein n=1 Tax=Hymenolepis diminuta TaxID=6216 RepID=A0A564Z1C8_HYMDI|nr:unnamed protein product [Hymenolepis diminuta]
MSRVRGFVLDYVQTHIKIYKIVACCALFVSLNLIIGGAILAARNNSAWDHSFEDFSAYVSGQSKYAAGIAMIMFGVFLFTCSIVFFCCSFQLKFVQRVVEPDNRRQQQFYPNTPKQPPPYPTNMDQIMPTAPTNPPPYPG